MFFETGMSPVLGGLPPWRRGTEPPAQSYSVNANGFVELPAGVGTITFTLAAPAAFAGTYSVDTADLLSGPVNLVSPSISGDPLVGQPLSTGSGLWAYDQAGGQPSVSRQWRANGAALPGAKGQTYVVAPANAGYAIDVLETAGNTRGTRSVATETLVAYGGIDVSVLGDATFEITADPGTVTVEVSAPPAFVGTYVFATALLDAGPWNLVPPGVSGGSAVGDTLTASPGLWVYESAAGNPVISYQWRRNGANIPGATAATYVRTGADSGAILEVQETATDQNGTRSAIGGKLLVEDSFDRPDGVLQSSSTWTKLASSSGATDFTISAGQVQLSQASGFATYRREDQLTGDQFAEIDIVAQTATGDAGCLIRIQDASNYYDLALFSSGDLRLRKRQGGGFTTLASKTGFTARPRRLRLEAAGNALRAYVNGVLELSATDAAFANGRVGLNGYKVTSAGDALRFDNFKAGNL